MYCKSRVPLLKPSTKTPVAIGSRVPAWPTFRVFKALRAMATTSWLVMPGSLSTTKNPCS